MGGGNSRRERDHSCEATPAISCFENGQDAAGAVWSDDDAIESFDERSDQCGRGGEHWQGAGGQ